MNQTKSLASNLGVSRLRPRQPTVSSKNNDAAPTVTGIPIRIIVPRTSRPTNSGDSNSPSISNQARRQSVTVSRIDGVQSTTQQPRRTSQPVQTTTTQLPSTTSNVRHSGQCIKCLRVLSLTVAGLLHSHGPGCPGSGQLLIPGSTQNVGPKQSCSTADSSDTTIPSSYAAQSSSPEDIMEMLRQRRCRVLKRVPKASRIPAAE